MSGNFGAMLDLRLFPPFNDWYFHLRVPACLYVCFVHASACRVQEGASDLLELQLQVVVVSWKLNLGPLRECLNHQTVSSAPMTGILIQKRS